MKKLFTIVALVLGIGGSGTASAGIPVIDVAAVAQAMLQVEAWAKQYAQMLQQLEHLQNTYNSMNGARGMGALANNPASRQYLPREWQQAMNPASGYNNLANTANAIKAAARIVDIAETGLSPDSPSGKAFLASQDQAALNRALGEESYRQASERFDAVQQLLDRVNTAPDQKDILDLQARIQSEQVMLQNEQNKLMALAQLQQAQKDIQRQQAREISLQSGKGEIPRFNAVSNP